MSSTDVSSEYREQHADSSGENRAKPLRVRRRPSGARNRIRLADENIGARPERAVVRRRLQARIRRRRGFRRRALSRKR